MDLRIILVRRECFQKDTTLYENVFGKDQLSYSICRKKWTHFSASIARTVIDQ